MISEAAQIDPSSEIGEGTEIGPWTLIGPDVKIGANCKIESHVVIKGPTTIGDGNHIYQFSTVGDDTPDLKYDGEPTRLEIGDNNVIREGVTIHRGTVQDKSLTKIGDGNLLMAYVHVGHDCIVGNNVILINNASLAGHVFVDDWAIISGYSLIHQFCRVGAHSYTGMASHVLKDVPAYMKVYGQPGEVRTINKEGLRRRDYSAESIAMINKAFKLLYRRNHNLNDALELIREMAKEEPALDLLLSSIDNSERGIIR